MLKHRPVLTWLWRAWALAPIVVVLGSLVIGYLRSSSAPDLPATRDSLEALVGLGFSALVCLPLAIAAYDLEERAQSSAERPRRWLPWLLLTVALPLGFCMFFTYLFGALGMFIRSLTMSIFAQA